MMYTELNSERCTVKLLKMTQSIDGKVMGVDDRDLQLRVLRGRCKMSAMMCRIMPVTSKEVRVRTSGSGSSKVLNPDPSKGPGLAICMNLNLNIGSGSGANPVHRVREPDRGQSTPHQGCPRYSQLCIFGSVPQPHDRYASLA